MKNDSGLGYHDSMRVEEKQEDTAFLLKAILAEFW